MKLGKDTNPINLQRKLKK